MSAEPAAPDGGERLLDRRLEVETPEHVHLVYDLAGIGSRFAAGTIDFALLCIPWTVLLCTFAAWVDAADFSGDQAAFLGLAFLGAAWTVLGLYYLGFEALWGGQTPGKRMLRLRVVAEDGGPAAFVSILVRNVLRIADGLPVMVVAVLGGVVMFVSERSKRLGDYAAGTVVVREREEPLALERLPDAPAPAEDTASVADADRARSYLARRRELAPARRAAVAEALCRELAARYDLPDDDPDALLGLVAAGTPLARIRALRGPRPDAPEAPR